MIVAIRTLFTLPQPLNILRVWHLTTVGCMQNLPKYSNILQSFPVAIGNG